MTLVLVAAAIVTGLFIHFKKTRELTTTHKDDPDVEEAVLMLSTSESSNVPMVITSTGESHFDFRLCTLPLPKL